MTSAGSPKSQEIRLFHPDVGEEEIAALTGVIENAWLGRGPQSASFEREFAAHLGVSPDLVLSVNSATDGLFYIADALQLSAGDEIIAPSISFVGAAQAAAHSGARVVLCDTCPRSLNVRIEDLERVRTRRSRALMLLHFGGVACDMDAITQWCDTTAIALVEDTACAPATRWRGRATGTFGAFGAWSFDSMKIMTAGEGGLVYAADPVARRLDAALTWAPVLPPDIPRALAKDGGNSTCSDRGAGRCWGIWRLRSPAFSCGVCPRLSNVAAPWIWRTATRSQTLTGLRCRYRWIHAANRRITSLRCNAHRSDAIDWRAISENSGFIRRFDTTRCIGPNSSGPIAQASPARIWLPTRRCACLCTPGSAKRTSRTS